MTKNHLFWYPTAITQHYFFAVNAFVDVIYEFGGERYDFDLRSLRLMRLLRSFLSPFLCFRQFQEFLSR